MDNIKKFRPDGIVLCQPDSFKGCSLCCGLFNLRDVSRQALTVFLEKGSERESLIKNYEDYIEPVDVRDRESHVCPYQGFLSEGKPGCLLHPLYCGEEKRGRSLFSEKICSGFLCPAHYLLNMEEKKALIKLVNDWYLYSVAIADPLFFSQIYKKRVAEFPIDREEGMVRKLINLDLLEYAKRMMMGNKALFSYSVSEYNCSRME